MARWPGRCSARCNAGLQKYELKFGVYLSPWDRNHADYGTPAYIDYYRNQLNELFTTYGPVFEMWFDGANGGDGYYGGKRERRNIPGATYYDWPGTLNLVRELEPEILFFSDAGPGVRWVGNERGIAGETNWNTITPDTLYAGKAGIEKLLNTGSKMAPIDSGRSRCVHPQRLVLSCRRRYPCKNTPATF